MPAAASRADLIVLAPDRPDLRLVVEIEHGQRLDVERVMAQVKSYMQGANCPLGLIITPTRSWLLRDEYATDGAVEVSEYATAALLGVADVPERLDAIERLVGRWLETLTTGVARGLEEGVRRDVSRYLLPALVEGRIESGSLT